MALSGQHTVIGIPKIGVAHGALAIHSRQGLPQRLRCLLTVVSQSKAHHLAGISVHREPHPLLLLLAPYKGP